MYKRRVSLVVLCSIFWSQHALQDLEKGSGLGKDRTLGVDVLFVSRIEQLCFFFLLLIIFLFNKDSQVFLLGRDRHVCTTRRGSYREKQLWTFAFVSKRR